MKNRFITNHRSKLIALVSILILVMISLIIFQTKNKNNNTSNNQTSSVNNIPMIKNVNDLPAASNYLKNLNLNASSNDNLNLTTQSSGF